MGYHYVGQLILCLVLMLNFVKEISLCQERERPLLLTPYLDRNEGAKARGLSRVDRNCLESFVPESFAGFLTTDKTLGNHLFFWFFPSEKVNAPLILWLNGGPTVSSMIGLFWEHGPMSIVEGELFGRDDGLYLPRKYSWTKSFSMLYVDNPVGVGFSYSETKDHVYKVTQKDYTQNLFSFVNQFFELFPEYRSMDFYVGGQSYAGKYVPALAYRIHQENSARGSNINLTGIFLGAPFFDPETQAPAHYDYLYALGVISHKQWKDTKLEIARLFVHAGLVSSSLVTSNLTQSIFRFHLYGSLDNYVTRQPVHYQRVARLLEDPRLKMAANVGDRPFIESDPKLYQAFGPDWIVSTKLELKELLNNYKVLIYNGDYDVVINSPMIEVALMSTPWAYQDQYNNASRRCWKLGSKVVGFWTHVDRLCRVVIHGAGHQVPHDTPEVAFLMLQQFVGSGCLSNVASDEEVTYSFSSSISVSICLGVGQLNCFSTLLIFFIHVSLF